MSDLKKDVENLEEVNAVTANAAPAEPTHLKNDGEDLGKAVVKPTDPDGQTAVKKVSKVSVSLIALRPVFLHLVYFHVG